MEAPARSESLSSSSPLKRAYSTGARVSVPSNLRLRVSSRFPHTNGGGGGATSSSSTFPTADFDLPSLKSLSYTSLKDLIPSCAAVNSPRAAASSPSSAAGASHFEISIRNRLVKQAACAYLQPLSSPFPPSTGRHFLRRLRFSAHYRRNPFAGCLDFIDRRLFRAIGKALDCLLRSIRALMTRTR